MPDIQVPLEELRKCKLMIGTPMYGAMCTGTFAKSMQDLQAMCNHYGIQMFPYYLFNESLITRARNYVTSTFMNSDATHLMFIDSDIGFNPNDVLALLALSSQKDSPYDIIGGPYPKKCISWEKVKAAVDQGKGDNNPNDLEKYIGDYVFNPKATTERIAINEPCEVMEIGTGFMMIRRETFEKFDAAYPQYLYRPDHVRTAEFDGSKLIMQHFQAEIDRPDALIELKPILEKIAAGEGDAQVLANQALADFNKKLSSASLRYLSEDYWFTRKCQDIGLKTWLCPWMSMTHTGSYVFGGSLADLASINVSATADPNALKK